MEQSSPHPRGDGPVGIPYVTRLAAFSPPAWGWSAGKSPNGFDIWVLPTRVGMVRHAAGQRLLGARSPHPRGDGPPLPRQPGIQGWFSPPAWGWSGFVPCGTFLAGVLPTRVGMVRNQCDNHECNQRSPHPRGDGPTTNPNDAGNLTFSPPAWGWSEQASILDHTIHVLPTRVGMVRRLYRRGCR